MNLSFESKVALVTGAAGASATVSKTQPQGHPSAYLYRSS
jgi:hypothetical protein